MHNHPPIVYATGSRPQLTCVMVHGRGLDAASMRGLADRIGLPAIRYVFPVATGNSWYPDSFLAPLENNEPALSAALAHYDSVVDDVIAKGIVPEHIVLAGFSQGACLTTAFLQHRNQRFGGAVLWTGGLIGPDGTDWPPTPALSGMLVYLTTSDTDPFVPAERVRQTVGWLRASGALVTAKIFAERAHEVSEEEISAARNLLLAVSPRAAAPRRFA